MCQLEKLEKPLYSLKFSVHEKLNIQKEVVIENKTITIFFG